MRSPGAPPLACWIMETVLPAGSRSAMLGDLIEEYAVRKEAGPPWVARFWFWSQAVRSVSFQAWSVLREASPATIGIAALVYLAMAALKIAVLVLLSALGTSPRAEIIISPFVFLLITGSGGCLAARLRRQAAIFLALMVGLTVVTLVAIEWCRTTVPWWYQFGFFAAGPLNVLIAPGILRRPAGDPAAHPSAR